LDFRPLLQEELINEVAIAGGLWGLEGAQENLQEDSMIHTLYTVCTVHCILIF